VEKEIREAQIEYKKRLAANIKGNLKVFNKNINSKRLVKGEVTMIRDQKRDVHIEANYMAEAQSECRGGESERERERERMRERVREGTHIPVEGRKGTARTIQQRKVKQHINGQQIGNWLFRKA